MPAKSSAVAADKATVTPTPKKTRPKRPPKPATSTPKPVGIVVRRGAIRRFNALARKTAHLPVVLTWDRREADRRSASRPPRVDERQADRRQKPPFTWEVADFVVLDPAPRAAARRMAKGTKAPVARKRRA